MHTKAFTRNDILTELSKQVSIAINSGWTIVRTLAKSEWPSFLLEKNDNQMIIEASTETDFSVNADYEYKVSICVNTVTVSEFYAISQCYPFVYTKDVNKSREIIQKRNDRLFNNDKVEAKYRRRNITSDGFRAKITSFPEFSNVHPAHIEVTKISNSKFNAYEIFNVKTGSVCIKSLQTK